MFSIMHFLLFGVFKIGKNPDHDVIRMFLPTLKPLFFSFLEGFEGWGSSGLLAALHVNVLIVKWPPAARSAGG